VLLKFTFALDFAFHRTQILFNARQSDRTQADAAVSQTQSRAATPVRQIAEGLSPRGFIII